MTNPIKFSDGLEPYLLSGSLAKKGRFGTIIYGEVDGEGYLLRNNPILAIENIQEIVSKALGTPADKELAIQEIDTNYRLHRFCYLDRNTSKIYVASINCPIFKPDIDQVCIDEETALPITVVRCSSEDITGYRKELEKALGLPSSQSKQMCGIL